MVMIDVSEETLKNMKEGYEIVDEKLCDNYYIIRTYSAGVFAGEIEYRDGKEAKILNSRRIWYWDGASSLSQLAMEGTKKPDNCKFPRKVLETELTEVIEVIRCTEQARKSIEGVKIWEQ